MKAASRAASYERKFFLYQQQEISKLRKTTQRLQKKVHGDNAVATAGAQTQTPQVSHTLI